MQIRERVHKLVTSTANKNNYQLVSKQELRCVDVTANLTRRSDLGLIMLTARLQ